MVKNAWVVPLLHRFEALTQCSGLSLRVAGDELLIEGSHQPIKLFVHVLHNASSHDVESEAGPDTFLILMNPSLRATVAAQHANFFSLPGEGLRLVAPGVAVSTPERMIPRISHHPAKLRNAAGVVVETLLERPSALWKLSQLALDAKVDRVIVHRVFRRLELEGLIRTDGTGPRTTRQLINPPALAERWIEEDPTPAQPILSTYLYGRSPEDIMRKVADMLPDSCAGGIFAANRHIAKLASIPLPLRVWVPFATSAHEIHASGIGETLEGANVAFFSQNGDYWRPRTKESDGIRFVSLPRAWKEIARSHGRVGELADQLMEKMI